MRRWFLPDGLMGRFALLLTLALLAANAVALALIATERDRLGRLAREEGQVARVLALVPLLDGASPAERMHRTARARWRGVRIEASARAVVPADAAGPRERALAARLSEGLGDRDLRLAAGRDPGTLVLSVALIDPDGWMNAVLRLGPPARRNRGPEALLILLGSSLVAVLGVGLLFLRQLTRPLQVLAEAARAAGRGDRTRRVPEEGARELREAAAAFNDMQARIARFDAERTRTLAAVGHDLRTPITSLRIRAEMLPEADAGPMIATLDAMGVMADGLVAYARGAGDAEALQTVNLADLLARLCRERGATFGQTAAPMVRGRPVALARAVGNLIDNALRYGGAARVHLGRDAETAVIAVEDDGPGIAPERLSAMFEPFVRGETSRSVETGGVGLGLSIVQQIVRAHGGTVELANRSEGGLRATLRLPPDGSA